MAGVAEVAVAHEDRFAGGEARRIGQRELVTPAARPGCRELGRCVHLGGVLGGNRFPADQGRGQHVIIHEVRGGKQDREVEPVEPPARQRVVEFADAVGFVAEQPIILWVVHCWSPLSTSWSSGMRANSSSRAGVSRLAASSTIENTLVKMSSESTGKMPTPRMDSRISRYITSPPTRLERGTRRPAP